MKKSILYIISICLVCIFSACEHKELCYHHPHNARIRIDAEWSQFKKEVPTGMTVMVYPLSGGDEIAHLTNTTTHAYLNLPAGMYHSIVYNQSAPEYGSVSFRGMDKYETAEVYANATRSSWYKTRGEDEKLGTEPEWIGTDRVEDMEVTDEMVKTTGEHLLDESRSMPDFVIGTHYPENIIYTVTVTVQVKGIQNYRSARASLDGLAEGYLLGLGKVKDDEVTQLMEEWSKSVDGTDPTKGVITTRLTCFGLPGNHTAQPDENELKLSILLVDNKTVVDFPFKVGDKFEWVDKEDLHLRIDLVLDDVLPDVQPEGGSSSGFNATVDDWGDEEDYEVDI